MKYIVNSSQILHSIAIKQEERRVEVSGKIFLMIFGIFFTLLNKHSEFVWGNRFRSTAWNYISLDVDAQAERMK